MSDIVALSPNDDDTTRAINILSVGGFVINETVEKMLPRLANAIRIYRELDQSNRRSVFSDNLCTEQFTAPWPSR